MSSYNIEGAENITNSIINDSSARYGESLSDSEVNFKFQLIKGRMAENLIQELFLSEGYQVFKFGIENNLPYLMQQINCIYSPTALSLRIAPDLIIFDSKTKGIYYAEVKFCSNGSYTLNPNIDLDKYINCYPNTVFFIVSKLGILEVEVEQFRDSKTIDLTEKGKLISENSIFNLRPGVIEQFEKISLQLYSNISKML